MRHVGSGEDLGNNTNSEKRTIHQSLNQSQAKACEEEGGEVYEGCKGQKQVQAEEQSQEGEEASLLTWQRERQ